MDAVSRDDVARAGRVAADYASRRADDEHPFAAVPEGRHTANVCTNEIAFNLCSAGAAAR